ncbi:serine--tRNA ligase [Candidatus Cardinium hertigii]|uniref:Serine--tRNA ligase n=1 Tax=Candidatus Cardinium hertigii TaxID=247481 RepID=A0A2Z3L712_9BACT|nr:serine--tRNA ligase [Candidatus Cardinium hertigii]AWN81447.1 Serine--tRNA ligase [Candidatus Cardinium hertigii]
MIDLRRIRENPQAIMDALSKRGMQNAKELVDEVYTLDLEKRRIQAQLEEVSSRLNSMHKTINHPLHQTATVSIGLDQKEATHHLKEKHKILMGAYKSCESALLEKLYQLPNLPAQEIPIGKNAKDNQIIYQVADLPKVKPGDAAHWDLIKKYDLVDFELGNKITGAGFPLYQGRGARLQRALISFFLDKAVEAGYLEVQPPILVNAASAYATGQLPDKEGQIYHITADDLYLIPTAEVSITNMYRDYIVDLAELPIKCAGYTPCFRREAGSWGADVRGLNRLHQFDKVELVQICHPDHSYRQLEEMLTYVRSLLEQLELPYRVVQLCTGDLGFCAAMTYDIEVYSVAQDRWLEVSSISNFETFQANRLALRYKDKKKKSHLLHTLNGSALALPRIMAALLEFNQNPLGISIPKVLQVYTGFDCIV